MDQKLLEIINLMEANGESEDLIAQTVKAYKAREEGKSNDLQMMDATAGQLDTASKLETGSLDLPEKHSFLKDNELEFFSRRQKDARKTLEQTYPGFKFEPYFNSIKITSPDGKESDIVEFRIAPTGTDETQLKGISEKRQESYSKLTSFIDKHSSTKEKEEYNKKLQEDVDKYFEYGRKIEDSIDKESIKEKYSKDDIFKLEEIISYTPTSKLIGGIQKSVTTKQPYEQELKQAAKELGVDASKGDIEARAREILIYKDIVAQRDAVSEELIEDDEEYKSILERGGKEFAKIYAPKQKLLYSINNNLENGEDVKTLKELDGKFSNVNYKFDVLEGEETINLRDGRQVPVSEVNKYNNAIRNVRIDISHSLALQEELGNKLDLLESSEQQLDLLKRNYNGLQKFFVSTGVSTAQLIDGAGYGLKSMLTINTPEDDKEFIKRQEIYQGIRDKFEKDVAFENAFNSVENFGTFVAQELANQLPIFASLTTPAGFAVIGASGFGEQYSNMTKQQLDPKVRAEYSEVEKWFKSLGYGGAEVVFGAMPTARLVRGAAKSGPLRAAITGEFNKYYKETAGAGIVNVGAEMFGEGLTVVSQNMINGTNIMENVDHAMFSGALFGSGFATVPLLKGAVIQYYSTAEQYQSITDKQKQLIKLTQLNQELTKEAIINKAVEVDVEANKKSILDLEQDINNEILEIENKITQTYGQVAEQFVGAINDLTKLRAEYQRISDSDMDAEAKQQLLSVLEQQHYSLESGIREFKKSKTFNNAWALYSNKRKNKDEVKRIKDLAEQQLTDEGASINDAKIEDRARLIYNTEQILSDIKLNKSKGTNLSKSLKDVQTKEQAIQYINSVYDARIKAEPDKSRGLELARQQDINSVQEGSHGFNIQTVDGRKSLIIVDNMAADDRLEIRTHELKHQVFIDVLGTDPNAYQDMADQIMNWLEVNNKEAFDRVSAFAERDANGNLLSYEVLAVFFEEVAAGRINLNNDSRFAGLLGFFVRDGAKKKGMNIDLAGEQDAVKFLIGLATKIKNGTLDLEGGDAVVKQRIKEEFAGRNGFLSTVLLEKSTLKSSRNQQGVFKDSNDALIEGLQMLGLENADLFALDADGLKDLRKNQPDVFNKMVKDWNNLGDSRLWLGSSLGPVWRTFSEVNYLSKRDKATNYDLLKDDILDMLTTGVQPGDNGIPYIVRSWLDENMASGNIRSLNSHIFGLINTRLMAKDGIIDRKFPRLGMKTVALDAPTITGRAADLEGGETIAETLTKEKQKQTLLEKATEYNSRKAIGIDDTFAAEIESIVEEILLDSDLVDISEFEFTQKFKKKVEDALYKKIKAMMGKGVKGREQFLKKYRKDIMRIANTASLVQLEKNEKNKIFAELVSSNQGPEVIKKAINDGLVQPFEVKNLEAGNNIYKKITPSESDFVEFFSVRGRENALAKVLAFNIGMDAVFPVVNKNEVVKKTIGGEAGIKALKARINRNQDITVFSKNISKLELFGKNYLAQGLDKLIKELETSGNFNQAFNAVYPKSRDSYNFEGKRLAVIKDLQKIIADYEDYKAISAARAVRNETTLLEHFNKEVQERDEISVSDIRAIFGLEKGSVSFSSKDQLISARKALLELCKVLGKSKSQRFLLPAVGGPAKIGSTEYIAKGIDLLSIGLSQRKLNNILAKPKNKLTSKDKAKIRKYEKTIAEGIEITGTRYGLVDSSSDFENNFMSELTDDNLDILKPNAQNTTQYKRNKLDQDYKELERKAKVEKEALVEIADALIALIKSNTISKNDAGMIMMSLANAGMNTPIARAATPRYFPATDVKGPFRWEHMIPRKIVANYMSAYINGSVDKKGFKKLLNNFHIAVIPESTDNGLKKSGLESMMHAEFNLDNIYDIPRYINNKTLGFWDIALFDLKNKEVVPETLEWAEANAFIMNDIDRLKQYEAMSKAMSLGRTVRSSRGMSAFDFDETLIIDGENFIVAKKDGEEIKISSGDWPIKGPALAQEGWDFDFSDFVNVRGGVDGPLLTKFKERLAKFGPSNMYILTARPQSADIAIHGWLKSKGLNIPLKNITGLGNSTGDAKAEWMLNKFAEGYNDMYFVDDALPNVKAVKHVLSQLDIKSDVQQAKTLFSDRMSVEFNKMIERKKGVAAEKRFSRVVGQKRGKNIGRYRFFVPPSAEDFAGLLYDFYGKGKQGDADMQFFKRSLLDPFGRADREMSMARMSILEDYKTLRKQLPEVKKKLGKIIDENTGFTFDNAIRVYLFDKAGFEVPGISKRDLDYLKNIINTDQDLKTFADILGLISKKEEGYIEPGENWSVETISSDLENIVNKIGRKKYLAEFIENKNIIFSPENMNKIEAVYGSRFRTALEDSLYRMENGTNRSKDRNYGQSWTNWVNGSVGAIMFFNARSAVLQTLSTVNFINFQDNNIFKAGKAFANQKQYWSDFTTLFNSDFLKARRAGLQINVNEAELANAVAGAQNRAKAALAYLLKKGFLPTQAADSFAIASGGATFYRNRIETYVKDGFSQKAAEEKAFLDFQEIAQETQQSARPDRISQQQASPLGRLILAFANTPMQYNRLIKKAARDLINNRGDWRSNISRILYYGAIQNVIFSAMQSAIFALSFDDEEDDELDKRTMRVANTMIDTILRGSGVTGAAVATIKNTIMRFIEESEKESRADYGQVVVEAIQVSPPMGSKARKLYSALNAYKFNREIMGSMDTFDYNNPIWDAIGNVTTAATNVPLDRFFRKTDNIREAFNQENSAMQRAFLLLGWSSWDLQVGERVVVNKGKKNEYVKYLDTKRQAQEEAEEKLKEAKKKEKQAKQQRCVAMTASGTRCKNMVTKPKRRCYAHD